MEEDIQLVDYFEDSLPKDEIYVNYTCIPMLVERIPRAWGEKGNNIVHNPKLG